MVRSALNWLPLPLSSFQMFGNVFALFVSVAKKKKIVCFVQHTFVGFGDSVDFCWLWFSQFYLALVRFVCLSLLCLYVTRFVMFCWFSLVWRCNIVSILCPTICWSFFHQLWWNYWNYCLFWRYCLERFIGSKFYWFGFLSFNNCWRNSL